MITHPFSQLQSSGCLLVPSGEGLTLGRPTIQTNSARHRYPAINQMRKQGETITACPKTFRTCSQESIPVAQRKQVPATRSRMRSNKRANCTISSTPRRGVIVLQSLHLTRHLEMRLQQRSVLTRVPHIASECPSRTTPSHRRASSSGSCGRVRIVSTLGLLPTTCPPMTGNSTLGRVMRMPSSLLRGELRERRAAGHSHPRRTD